MLHNSIRLADGTTLEITELFKKRSSLKSIILSKTFLQLCEFVAAEYYSLNVNSPQYKTMVNLLFLKSNRLRTLACVIEFEHTAAVESIDFDCDLSGFAHFFKNKNVAFHSKNNKPVNWINNNELLFAILKWTGNALFNIIYFFTRKKIANHHVKTVIRSWVDDAEKIYPEEFKTSIIFIYPFFLNPVRGLKYIVHCFKTYKYPVLIGIPYSIKKLFKILFSRNINFDRAILDFEYDSIVRHVSAFRNYDLIYTSDEYMVNSYVLHSLLLAQNKTVINKAHGIGYYSPYVAYSEMHMYNDNQIEHYRNKNKDIAYYILEEYIVKKINYGPDKKPAIVYIDHWILERYSLFYEADLQRETIRKLSEIGEHLNIPVYVKFSPHNSAADMKEFLKTYSHVSICTNIKELAATHNILFVNLFSTAYYDFSKFGNVMFMETDVFKPAAMFGSDIDRSNLENLEQNITQKLLVN